MKEIKNKSRIGQGDVQRPKTEMYATEFNADARCATFIKHLLFLSVSSRTLAVIKLHS